MCTELEHNGRCAVFPKVIPQKQVIVFWIYLVDYHVCTLKFSDEFSLGYTISLAIAEAGSCWLPTTAARVRVRFWQVGFVVDKVASGQVFWEYFGFLCQNRSFHQLLHPHNHPGQTRRGLATSWLPVQGVQLTVLDLVTEMKRKVSWRQPRTKIGL
jgi:hypothetical protein